MPLTIAPKNPQLQAMASTEMTGYVAPPRAVTPPAQTGLCASKTFLPVIASARTDRVGVSSTIQMTDKAPVRILASQESTPTKKITMGLDASHAADAILMPTSASSTPQPTSVEDGYEQDLPVPRCLPQVMSKRTTTQQEESSTSAAATLSLNPMPRLK